MREFTELDYVSNYWVYLNKYITLSITIWTTWFVHLVNLRYWNITLSTHAWFSWLMTRPIGLHLLAFIDRALPLILKLRRSLGNLKLTVLAEDFVTFLAFKWHIGEIVAHDAFDLINQLLLKLVLNFIFLDVNLGNRLRTHQLIDGSFRKN